MSINEQAGTVRGIATEQLGDILSMPSLGRNDIMFGTLTHRDGKKTIGFHRSGLDVLDNWSTVRHNPDLLKKSGGRANIKPVHKDCKKSIVSKSEPVCELCKQTLRKASRCTKTPLLGYSDNYVMVLFNHRGREIFACGECAGKQGFRDAIVELLPDTWENTIAQDGNDVYGFVEAIFAMRENGYRIHNIAGRPMKHQTNADGVPQSPYWPHAKDLYISANLAEKEESKKAKLAAKKEAAKAKK